MSNTSDQRHRTDEVDWTTAASRGYRPVAWVVLRHDGVMQSAHHSEAWAKSIASEGQGVVPVYVAPPASLTAIEQQAISAAISALHDKGAWQWAESLRGVHERLG
jgi:hypothetical protein